MLTSGADDATPRAAKEQAMIIEGRTITNVAEMLEFCLAAIAQTGVEPSAICLPARRAGHARRRDHT